LDFDFRFACGLRTVRKRPTDSPREDFPCGQSAVQSRTVRFFGVRLCWFGVLFGTVRVWWPVHRSHMDSPHRLLQFRVWASVLVCLLPFLVPRLLGGSFEVVWALFGILFVRVGSWSCDWGIGRIQPNGRFFIGSHSLPPSLVARIGPSNPGEKELPNAWMQAPPDQMHFS
jgi:hypothetical protein